MPRGNRTGPRGFGPRTGRGLGFCAGYSTPGYTKGLGMGWARGYGLGRGWRGGRGGGRGGGFNQNPFYYPPDIVPPYLPATEFVEDEPKFLEETLSGLKKEIELIEKRLKELASEKKE